MARIEASAPENVCGTHSKAACLARLSVVAAFLAACGSPKAAEVPPSAPAPTPAPTLAPTLVPTLAPTLAPTPAPTSTALDGAAVQKVIAAAAPAIKRECWQPALDSRSSDALPSAKLATSIDIDPDGAVEKASVGAEPAGYRGLSACVERALRKLRFPSSQQPTTVNIPFVFGAE